MRILAVSSFLMAAGLALASVPAGATTGAVPKPATPEAAAPASALPGAPTASPDSANPLLAQDGAPAMALDPKLGMPQSKLITLQDQVTPNGREAHWFHNAILLPLITVISLFVLFLLLWVIFRYRRAANPEPSRTSHNTVIEIVWTLLPVLILVAIAIPSIRLLAHQFKPAPDNAVTLKAIGNQWFWSYEYPDNGIQITANMLKEQNQVEAGQRYRTDADGPRLLATDNRVVLPINTPIRLITTGNDVIHSWAIPAFWIKLDAVPGRLNETSFTINKPGVYFGQCSELCGMRHAFMPIVVEAVTPDVFAAWVKAKGGHLASAKPAAAAPAPAAAPAADANASAAADNAAAPEANASDNAVANAE